MWYLDLEKLERVKIFEPADFAFLMNMDFQTLLNACIDLSSKSNWKSLESSLKELLDGGNKSSFKSVPGGVFLQALTDILSILLGELEKDSNEVKARCVADCFRCLRQACGTNHEIQRLIGAHTDLLNNTKLVLVKVLSFQCQSNAHISILKCGIQFLGNACVHSNNRRVVWNCFLPITMSLIQHPDIKVSDYTCMLIHQCLLSLAQNDILLLNDHEVQNVSLSCIQATTSRDLEWGIFVLEDLLSNEKFLSTLYPKMTYQERLLLMEVILAKMNELSDVHSTEGESTISPANIYFIVDEVKREFSQILNLETTEYSENEKTLVIVKELEILAGAAAYTTCFPCIQSDKDLLKSTISLLQSIHIIGKTGNNVFTKVEKACRQDEVNPNHPVYGLKKDLIRLIGNMAYHNKENQDMVRILEGIPLILDQTSIDCHNPYITQWVVLAVRNLLENNPTNREVLSGMTLQGMSGHMESLRDMGVETELKGGKIIVKPVVEQSKK